MLGANFEFDGEILQDAIEKTFRNRNTELPDKTHVVFSAEFANRKIGQWDSFTRKIKNPQAVTLDQVIQLLRDFLIPVVDVSRLGNSFNKKWKRRWR